jgi:hypothetical protein
MSLYGGPTLSCPDCYATFRSQHERQRHLDQAHAPTQRVWICVQPAGSPFQPRKPLDDCKPCKQGRQYSVYYNAAAHLRRAHFCPRRRGRRSGTEAAAEHSLRDEARREPSIDEMKAHGWLKEITVSNSGMPIASDGDEDMDNASRGEDRNPERIEPQKPVSNDTSWKDLELEHLKELGLTELLPLDAEMTEFYETSGTIYDLNHLTIGDLGTFEDGASFPDFNMFTDFSALSAANTNPKDLFNGVSTDLEISGNTMGTSIVRGHDTKSTIDVIQATDSGYGTRQGSSKIDGRTVIGEDNESVATDEIHALIPGQDKYLLEVAFAREIYKRFGPLTPEQFALRSELMMELLYAFSVMIGKRASSVEERAAASFVRRGRK